jgi:hypothetical protein
MTNTMRLACISSLVAVLACDKSGSEASDEAGSETGMSGDGDGDPGDGDGDGDGQNESLFGDCGNQVMSVVEDLDQIPAGFDSSVTDVIASVVGNFSGTFTWAPTEGGWTVTHAGTESPLTAALTHAGGEVRLYEVELNGMPNELGSLCTNYLQVDMQFDFATEDGVFAESLTVPVWIPGPGSESVPAYYYVIDFDTHMGSLALGDFTVDQGMVSGIVLSGQLDDVGLAGELGMEVIISEGPDGIVGFGLMADYAAARVP